MNGHVPANVSSATVENLCGCAWNDFAFVGRSPPPRGKNQETASIPMKNDETRPFRPDFRDSGVKSTESDTAQYTWFGPEGEPESRFRYAVIKEEGDLLSIQPGEARFKKGLTATRYTSQGSNEGRVYRLMKTRPTRIDLAPVTKKD